MRWTGSCNRIVCFVCFVSLMGPAIAAEQGEIIRTLSDADAERLARTIDPKVETLGQGSYRLIVAGSKCLLISRGDNVQFYAGFKLRRRRATLATINGWNASKRYSRAYIDKDGDPVVESDLDLSGGVSPRAVEEFLKTWRTVVPMFKTHIGFSD